MKNKHRFLFPILLMAFVVAPIFAQGAGLSYVPMENIPGYGKPSDFPTYVVSIYKFGIGAIGICAMLMIIIGGYMYITSAGNATTMGKAKGVITDAIIGLIMALASWLLLYVINPDLIQFTPLAESVGSPSPGTPGTPGTPGSKSCSNPDTMKEHLASGGKVCGNQGCSSTSDECKNNVNTKYSTMITAAGATAEEAPYIKAIICRESKGDPNADNKKGDCGLMQINNSSYVNGCPAKILDPQTNITQGVALFKSKKPSSAGSYASSGIDVNMMAFANYNCCANQDLPNDASNSCNPNDGWPKLPKWACPIDPGTGSSNMCAVKDYACDVSACAKKFL
jgi:hypothetical protein